MSKDNSQTPIVKKTLFHWAFSGNMGLQFTLLAIIVVTVFARVLPLEMQKRIINDAIELKNFEKLLLYCGIYLVAVITASLLKFAINYLQTLIGQRAMTEMRKELYHHILTLPLNFFRKTQPGMVVSSLITELNTAGSFAGMALSTPVINLLTLFAFAGYLIWLNPLLAVVTLSIYPIVLILVPILQKGANKANKQRVKIARDVSSNIAESMTGVHEIQAHGSFNIENTKFDDMVDRLLKIRIIWSVYRFAVKVSNNFFVSLGPFVVFILGGWLIMNGELELGAMVAFLSAQEKLYDPWKELIEFYQVYQDASVRYKGTMEYFDVDVEFALDHSEREPYQLGNGIEIKGVTFETDEGIKLLNQVNLSLAPGEHLALVGFSGSGKSTLAQCIGQLYKYSEGNILIDGKDMSELSKRDIVNTIGYISQSPFVFTGSIGENLIYSYSASKNHGAAEHAPSEEELPDLDRKIEALQQAGIFVDVLRFGLNTVIDSEKHQEFISKLLRVRQNYKENFGESLAQYVEFFQEDKYLNYSTVSENIIFGSAKDPQFKDHKLSQNTKFGEFLNKADLTRPLLDLGSELTKQTVDILKGLPQDDVFFENSPITANEFDSFELLNKKLRKTQIHELPEEDKTKLLELALRFIPGKHKMTALQPMLERLILEARSLFRQWCEKQAPDAFSFYLESEYITDQSILNNIFFGKATVDSPQAQDKINQSIVHLLIEEDCLEYVAQIGMEFQVGSKGDKLSGGQRQKLAIARVFLKRPGVMIMDEATSALDNKSQARIQKLLESRWKGKCTVISVVHRLDIVKSFDRVAVMKAGKLVEIGTYDDLVAKKGLFYELAFGKQ